jgi:hypothetical protein
MNLSPQGKALFKEPKFHGVVAAGNKPYIIQESTAGAELNNLHTLTHTSEVLGEYYIHHYTKYPVKNKGPFVTEFWGDLGGLYEPVPRVELVALPVKPKNLQELKTALGITDGDTSEYALLGRGERYDATKRQRRGKEETEVVNIHHFIGSFHSDVAGKELFVYGSNEVRDHRLTITQLQSVAETAAQTVSSK